MYSEIKFHITNGMLGQSYMPSQEFHILKSYENINPWYFVEDDKLDTPEWLFNKGSLMEF